MQILQNAEPEHQYLHISLQMSFRIFFIFCFNGSNMQFPLGKSFFTHLIKKYANFLQLNAVAYLENSRKFFRIHKIFICFAATFHGGFSPCNENLLCFLCKFSHLQYNTIAVCQQEKNGRLNLMANSCRNEKNGNVNKSYENFLYEIQKILKILLICDHTYFVILKIRLSFLTVPVTYF